MGVYKRKELKELFKKIDSGTTDQIYLVHGDRYLTKQASENLIRHILPDEKTRQEALTHIDGDREDGGNTLNQLRTFSMFGGRRVIRVMDSRLLHSKVVAADLWQKAKNSFEKNDRKGAARYLRQVLEIGGVSIDELDGLSAASWKSRFGFAHSKSEINWAIEVLSDPDSAEATAVPSNREQNISDQYMEALSDGLPSGNILVLTSEAVDKRKKLYKYIAEHGTVIDLAVESGTNKAATDAQKDVLRDIVQRILAENSKKMDPKCLDLFLERVGFHPVAAAIECEKLVLYAGDRDVVSVDDLNKIVGRTKEEAIFELAEVFSDMNLSGTLLVSSRLQEKGVHPLAIIASMRNHLKKLMLVRSAQELENPGYQPGVSFPAFQGGYLERLKKTREDWPKEFSGHPYAVYMTFKKAERFTLKFLTQAMNILLETEYNLKGSGLPDKLVLETMFFRMMDERFPAK